MWETTYADLSIPLGAGNLKAILIYSELHLRLLSKACSAEKLQHVERKISEDRSHSPICTPKANRREEQMFQP